MNQITDKQQIEQDFINSLLQAKNLSKNPAKALGHGEAPVNIALSKYWGKRSIPLNLPTNSSLSISLPGLGTKTAISLLTATENQQDQIWLNGKLLNSDEVFAKRLSKFLDYFRADKNQSFKIETENNVPTAAGLASSASGYAALVLAINDLFDWNLDKQQLSILARIGSGSASRSLYSGFAIWHQGQNPDGSDSFAEQIPLSSTATQVWLQLRIGLVKVDVSQKPISSTAGMQQTLNTCELYSAWPAQAENQVKIIREAVETGNFSLLGSTAEHNALSMHATMIATWPPIVYWQPESLAAMQKVWQLREKGVEVYFTMDAGPNLKLIYLAKDEPQIINEFKELETIQPFN